MTSDVRALYRDVIVDHSKHPRNFRPLEAGRKSEGHNPLCGDRLTVYVQIENGVIRDVSFDGLGCAIATASASLMTESRLDMKMSGGGFGSTVDLTAGADLVDAGDGTTLLKWSGQAEARGPIAAVGGRVLDAQAKKLITEAFGNVRRQLTA